MLLRVDETWSFSAPASVDSHLLLLIRELALLHTMTRHTCKLSILISHNCMYIGVPYYPSWNQDRPYLSGEFLLQPGEQSLLQSIHLLSRCIIHLTATNV
jgi:hypothetical protein